MTTIVVDWNNVYSDSLAYGWYSWPNYVDKIIKKTIWDDEVILWYTWTIFNLDIREVFLDFGIVANPTYLQQNDIRKKILGYMKDFTTPTLMFVIVVVSINNSYMIKYYKEDWVTFEHIKTPLAIWSGCDFAMWALAWGLSGLEALKVAIKLDNSTWWPITHLSLD